MVAIKRGRNWNSPIETLKPDNKSTNSEGSGITIDSMAIKIPAPKMPMVSTNCVAKSIMA